MNSPTSSITCNESSHVRPMAVTVLLGAFLRICDIFTTENLPLELRERNVYSGIDDGYFNSLPPAHLPHVIRFHRVEVPLPRANILCFCGSCDTSRRNEYSTSQGQEDPTPYSEG